MDINSIRKELNWQKDGVKFVVPIIAEEVMAEGRLMRNALETGYYNERHFNCESILVFVQRGYDEDGNTLNIDMAVENNEIVHAVRKFNAQITKSDLELLSEWTSEKGLSINMKRVFPSGIFPTE